MRHAALFALGCLSLGFAPSATAANVSFTGELAGDNDIKFFQFSVTSPGTVTIRTLSYAGGTNADGTLIANGGFDPILAVFGLDGSMLHANDDGNVPPDPVTGFEYDSLITLDLAPGDYFASLSSFANFPGTQFNFAFTGQGTPGFDGRTAFYAVDFLNVASVLAVEPPVVVPLPAGIALLTPALFVLASRTKRSRRPLS